MTNQHLAIEAEDAALSRCSRCRHLFTYPRPHCSRCGSLSITSEPIQDQGTVYTVTVVRSHPDPEFAALTPYAVAYVDLDRGGRVLTRLATPDATAVRIGDRVEVRSAGTAAETERSGR
ncbi:Zn-ribbon domain-containing OB-fold protein [Nocardia wallacei]|uniref:Zn-ribbon domain-containing OB-fold protein n=1 Tax=Nocardia wallacei TaxID=480035 RepID=UPI0024552E0E|nr:OB-fold domain-containing protein [Nocardia wallacei]